MANITHNMTLSTTEPNNDVGLIKVRQADDETQIFNVTVTENGKIKSFVGLTPFFCLMAREITGQGVSEEKVVAFDAKNGTLEYRLSANAFQMIGRNEAYFSFRSMSEDGRWIEQYSTRSFYYTVTKGIYTQKFMDSNYWWTFKELYRLFNTYMQDEKLEWEDFVNQNKNILQSVDPGGTILQELIDARDGAESLLDRLNNDFAQINNQDLNFYDDDLKFREAVFGAQTEKIKSEIDKTAFNLAISTDQHTMRADVLDDVAYDKAKYGYNHQVNFAQIANLVDVQIQNGDNVNSDFRTKKQAVGELNYYTDLGFALKGQADIFYTLGNHDDGSTARRLRYDYRSIYPDDFITDAEFRRAFKTHKLINGEVRDGDSLYFYKDYPAKKIRLIGLNSSDIPETAKSEYGSVLYDRWGHHVFQQAQIDWIANTALKNVPEDFRVVVVAHCPLQYQDGLVSGGTSYLNHEVVRGILHAFITGTSYAGSSDWPEAKVLVAADFSDQGPRTLVGYFCGHTHREKITIGDDGINVIECMNGWCNTAQEGRVPNAATEDAYTVVSIPMEGRQVNLYGFGNASNRQFNY